MAASKPREKKMRETDRLIFNIALCTHIPGDTIKQSEADVRRRLHESVLQNGKPEVVILREMWANLKGGYPHKRMNEMIANGYMKPLTFKEFEVRKEIYKKFQYRARHFEETKAKARAEGLIP